MALKEIIFNGIKEGFSIVDKHENVESYYCENYRSATEGPAQVFLDNLISQEIREFKYVKTESRPHCVHALGAVQKGKNEYRPITDCHRPLQVSINNFKTETAQEFTFKPLDDVCRGLEGDYMATIDIKAAYRSVSIRPEHWGYQGIEWEINKNRVFMVDTHLFLKCAPFIFSTLSNFVIRCLNWRGVDNVYCYLDDYIVSGRSFDECQRKQIQVIHLLIELGFNINWGKSSTPSTVCKYLGIIIDSRVMKLFLPAEKIDKFHKELSFFKDRKKASKRQLQRLCGVLNNCSRVIRGGRNFTRRIVQLLKGLPKNNVRVNLSHEFKADVMWWHRFAKRFNGVSAIIDSYELPHKQVYIDASPMGYGVWHEFNWVAGYYNEQMVPSDLQGCDQSHDHWVNIEVPVELSQNINVLETIPVLIMYRRYGLSWKDKKVLLFSDNYQVVSLINKGVSNNAYHESHGGSILGKCEIQFSLSGPSCAGRSKHHPRLSFKNSCS